MGRTHLCSLGQHAPTATAGVLLRYGVSIIVLRFHPTSKFFQFRPSGRTSQQQRIPPPPEPRVVRTSWFKGDVWNRTRAVTARWEMHHDSFTSKGLFGIRFDHSRGTHRVMHDHRTVHGVAVLGRRARYLCQRRPCRRRRGRRNRRRGWLGRRHRRQRRRDQFRDQFRQRDQHWRCQRRQHQRRSFHRQQLLLGRRGLRQLRRRFHDPPRRRRGPAHQSRREQRLGGRGERPQEQEREGHRPGRP